MLYTKYVIKDSLCKELHMKKTISKILIALVSVITSNGPQDDIMTAPTPDTQEWRRDSPFLAAAAAALSLSDEQLDALFTAAAEVTL